MGNGNTAFLFFKFTKKTKITATINIVLAQKLSDKLNLFQFSFTKVADVLTTVAINSQPVYIPKVNGRRNRPLACIDNSFSNINDNENRKPKINKADISNRK